MAAEAIIFPVLPDVKNDDLLSLNAFQSVLRDISAVGYDDSAFRRCMLVLAAFEAATDKLLETLVRESPNGKGNAEWLPGVIQTVKTQWDTSPLWKWCLFARTTIFQEISEQMFRVLMRTGCATSEALNAPDCEQNYSAPLFALLGNYRAAVSAICLLLSQPNIRVELPRCNSKTGRQCGVIRVNFEDKSLLAGLLDPFKIPALEKMLKERFANALIAEEYEYCTRGAFDGEDGYPVTLLNPLSMPVFSTTRALVDSLDNYFGWMAEWLPSKRLNDSANTRDNRPAVQNALFHGMPKLLKTLLARVPDCDLHVKDRYGKTAMTLVQTGEYDSQRIPAELIEEFRSKYQTFGPHYKSDVTTLAMETLMKRKGVPLELVSLLFQYADLRIPAVASIEAIRQVKHKHHDDSEEDDTESGEDEDTVTTTSAAAK